MFRYLAYDWWPWWGWQKYDDHDEGNDDDSDEDVEHNNTDNDDDDYTTASLRHITIIFLIVIIISLLIIRVCMVAHTKASQRRNLRKHALLSPPHRCCLFPSSSFEYLYYHFDNGHHYDHEMIIAGKHGKSGTGGDVFLLKTSSPEGQCCLCE